MTEQDQAEGRKLGELLARDAGARECLAVVLGETPLTIESWCSCYGADGEDGKTYSGDGVKAPEFTVDPTPEEVAARFQELALQTTTPTIEPQVDAATLDAMGADWVGRCGA
jgi:hypothetical protein